MKKFNAALILLWIFNIMDWLSTIYLIDKGICKEVNPFMNYLFINLGYIIPGVIKIILGSLGCYIFYIYRLKREVRIGGYFCFFSYLLLMIWHSCFYIFM